MSEAKDKIKEIIKKLLESREVFFPFISDLTIREETILRMRDNNQGSLADLAEKFKITRERVRQIESKARDKLRFKNDVFEKLAGKLETMLFTEQDIEKAFMEFNKSDDYTTLKIKLERFLELLRNEKK